MDKTVNITNFIGIYDNYISKEMCDDAIKLFEEQNKFNNTVNRIVSEESNILEKQDQQFFMGGGNLKVWWDACKPLMFNLDLAWKHYIKNTGAASAYGGDDQSFKFTCIKIQKTLPTEGFHVWHIEHGVGFETSRRAFVFSVYLNDIEDGGETEFLHFSRRVKPKKGRIVFWPAGFPYVHRGNPPLSGEKYIMTSWMLLG